MANSAFVRRLAGPFGPRRVWAATRSGRHVVACLDDYVGRAAFFAGDLDRKISLICQRVLRDGDTAVDVGANVGLITGQMSAKVGPAGAVHAFEPNPFVRELLEYSVSANHMSNVTVHDCALGDRPTTMGLCIPAGNLGAASLVRQQSLTPDAHVRVERLDSRLRAVTKPIRLIKIDVEGFENQVLSGASGVFEKQPPDVVICEANGNADSDMRLVHRLESWNYRCFALPRCLLRLRLHPASSGTVRADRCHEIVAIHPRAHGEVERLLGAPSES